MVGYSLVLSQVKHQRTPLHLQNITGNGVISRQLQCGAGIEGQVISLMAQRGILHTHRGTRTFHGGDTPALVDSPLLHAKAPTIKVSQGIHLCGAGESYFLCRTGHITLYDEQVIFCSRTSKDDITMLRLAFICIIYLQTGSVKVDGIPEDDSLPRSGRKRNNIITGSISINTAQAVVTIHNLGILIKFH